jgi:hypothetical protein
MRPQDAKQLLAQAIASAGLHHQAGRRTIATSCDLAIVGARCPAFDTFRADLVRVAFGP